VKRVEHRAEHNAIAGDVLTPDETGWTDSQGYSRDPGEISAIVLPDWIGNGGEFFGRGSTGRQGKIVVRIENKKCFVEVCDEV